LSTERANVRGAPPTAPYDGGKTTFEKRSGSAGSLPPAK